MVCVTAVLMLLSIFYIFTIRVNLVLSKPVYLTSLVIGSMLSSVCVQYFIVDGSCDVTLCLFVHIQGKLKLYMFTVMFVPQCYFLLLANIAYSFNIFYEHNDVFLSSFCYVVIVKYNC